jgi:hypothetical protein
MQLNITLIADFDPFQAGSFHVNKDVKTSKFMRANPFIFLGWDG